MTYEDIFNIAHKATFCMYRTFDLAGMTARNTDKEVD